MGDYIQMFLDLALFRTVHVPEWSGKNLVSCAEYESPRGL